MSKVIHLSEQAHNNAKNFCKQHALKMSDWVADLIADAIVNNRVNPRSGVSSSSVPRAAPPASPPPAAPVTPAIPKKKLERIDEVATTGTVDDVPPWAAPPFWAKTQNEG
jgi:hypothetical protein